MVVTFTTRCVKKRPGFNVKRLIIHFLLLAALAIQNGRGADTNGLTQPGARRARVVIVEDQQATVAFNPRTEKVRKLLARGVSAITLKPSPESAWHSLLSTQDIIGIKV